MTAKALELLKRVEAHERLLKANRNEQMYGSDEESDRPFPFLTYGETISERYADIAAGSDNGKCTTRRGTYLKLKYGNGKGIVK